MLSSRVTYTNPSVANVEPLETFTLLTIEANSLAAKIHGRMPVIVHPEDGQAWLAGKGIPLVPYPTAGMSAPRVSKVVNNSRNEGAECVAAP